MDQNVPLFLIRTNCMSCFVLSENLSLFNIYFPLLAPPVPLHPFTKINMVKRRNPHQKTGTCAVHRVSINGPLQTQRFHTAEPAHQMCSEAHKVRKFRRCLGKSHCQWQRYVGLLSSNIIVLHMDFFLSCIIHLLYFVF